MLEPEETFGGGGYVYLVQGAYESTWNSEDEVKRLVSYHESERAWSRWLGEVWDEERKEYVSPETLG